MANAMCIDKQGMFKLCPFRTFNKEHLPILKGDGTVISEDFYPCIGEKCIAYHCGICLRLVGNIERV